MTAVPTIAPITTPAIAPFDNSSPLVAGLPVIDGPDVVRLPVEGAKLGGDDNESLGTDVEAVD